MSVARTIRPASLIVNQGGGTHNSLWDMTTVSLTILNYRRTGLQGNMSGRVPQPLLFFTGSLEKSNVRGLSELRTYSLAVLLKATHNKFKEKFVKRIIIFLICLVTLSALSAGVCAEELKVEKGRRVKLDYTLSVKDEIIESTVGKEPLEYTQGDGTLLAALESKLEGMKTGEKKIIVISAQEGYGPVDPKALREVPKSLLPANVEAQPGLVLELEGTDGEKFPAIISEVKEDKIVLDFNHPLAGQELKFAVQVIEIK